MTRKKQMYLFLMVLSMMMLIGCGKSTSGTKEVTDGSIVVQVPEGSTVESLFDFTSTENISLSGAASGIIHVGNLANGNSVFVMFYIFLKSDSVFLYLQGKAQDVSVIYYSNRLDDDPIPYSEFKE